MGGIRRAFDGVDNVKDFDILKNRWFRTLKFFMLGQTIRGHRGF